MKNQLILFLSIIFLCSCSVHDKHPTSKKWLDKTGKSISEKEFQTKWRNPLLNNGRWDYIDSTETRTAVLIPQVERGTVDYKKLSQYLSSKTSLNIKKGTILLLEFNPIHDFCGGIVPYDKMTKKFLRERKRFYNRYKANLKKNHPDVVYLSFFEKSKLAEDLEEAPYFSDNKNILKKSIFVNPSRCGSYALIKPNGQMLLIHGEGRADYNADKYLKPGKWAQYFPVKEN